MKKIVFSAVSLLLCTLMLAVPALADGQSRIVYGADLTELQKKTVRDFFDVQENAVETLTVTIDEEKAYLGKSVPAEKIGTRSLSSIYIESTSEGSGLKVDTKNITWVTSDMYIAALTTAGVHDANIKVASPVKVSGTAALAGIYKAYEAITGEELSQDAKTIAGDELALTGDLAEMLGSDEATRLMGELKTALEHIKGKSRDEVRALVVQTAKDNNVELTDAQVDQITDLLIRMSQMNIDPTKLLEQARQFQALAEKVEKLQKDASGVGGWIANTWSAVKNWFASIFG